MKFSAARDDNGEVLQLRLSVVMLVP